MIQEKMASQRGGKRAGSGRKKLRPTTTITIRVSVDRAVELKKKFKELVSNPIS